jgi:hypothetical protein
MFLKIVFAHLVIEDEIEYVWSVSWEELGAAACALQCRE